MAPKYIARLRLETSGRNGKSVTIIDGLPKYSLFLKELTTTLKTRCGSGGTFRMDGKDGVIEIQGDKRDLIRAYFDKEGVQTKG